METRTLTETSENKVRTIFMGTFFTILVLLLSLSYGMTWGVLFLVYTSEYDYNPSCDNLIKWNKALYIVQFISAGLHLISSVIQLIATSRDRESGIPKYIMGCRSCLVYLAGLTILLGINISFFSHPNIDECGDLKILNLAYIIAEWTILGSCICLVYVVCIFSIIFKKRRRNEDNKL